MTRKDTILIAVVINAGLLAVLFTTAMIYDPDNALEMDMSTQNFVEAPKSSTLPAESIVAQAEPIVNEEVENVLSAAAPSTQQPEVVEVQSEIVVPEQNNISFTENKPAPETQKIEEEQNYTEVKVKKGDSLDKIARANETTVEAIKKASDLKSEKLKIGQILKVPSKKEEVETKKEEEPSPQLNEELVYYTIQSGDSPWKVAKKYKVNYEDILKLNDMDEDQARNLKIGDKIRIK